jgi:hypothetical protein
MRFKEMEALKTGEEVGPVTALLLADFGYAQLIPAEWVVNLRPPVILLSLSTDDRERLPSPEALQAVEGYILLRTDRSGWIELSTDGESMWVEVERLSMLEPCSLELSLWPGSLLPVLQLRAPSSSSRLPNACSNLYC